MKPDDIPEVIWEESLSLHRGCVMDPRRSAAIPIARAILQARSQAFEESAKIADENMNPGPMDAAQAIRQHSQKGKDTE